MTVKLTSGHLKLALFVVWMICGVPTVTWGTIVQFFPVGYLQVVMPYILLYGLLVSFELVRGSIKKGGN